ncbi:MAG: hypothetical protein WCY18_09000 [Methanofastidiosum sp.]
MFENIGALRQIESVVYGKKDGGECNPVRTKQYYTSEIVSQN